MSPAGGFDFDAAVIAPARMQPGLRRLAAGARQLTDLSPDSSVFAEKLQVLTQHALEALVCEDGFDAMPALKAVVSQAGACGSVALTGDADGVSASTIGWRVSWQGELAPLHAGAHAAAGRALAALPAERRVAGLLSLAWHEDLALVDGARASLPWMAVCLPSHWAPTEKVGRSFATVHGPVADNATLLVAAEHLSRLVCQPQRWERFVWNLSTHAPHDQHPRRHAREPWSGMPEAVPQQAFWRTEHQTFIPLPELRQALFTIHVAVEPLTKAIDSPSRAAALHAALGSMSEAVAAYKGITEARAPLLAWLASRFAKP
jgi:hypothetical protein